VAETKSSRYGIDRIASKMKWYSSLSVLVLDDASEQAKSYPDLWIELERKLFGHKKWLKVFVMSVCAHYRNVGLQHLRNLVQFGSWTKSLNDVDQAESDVKGAVNIYSSRENTTYLNLLFSLQLSSSQSEVMQKLATSVLRGLMWMLLRQEKSLIRHLDELR
jgi:N-terminal domain of NWD NACHT-NTPase